MGSFGRIGRTGFIVVGVGAGFLMGAYTTFFAGVPASASAPAVVPGKGDGLQAVAPRVAADAGFAVIAASDGGNFGDVALDADGQDDSAAHAAHAAQVAAGIPVQFENPITAYFNENSALARLLDDSDDDDGCGMDHALAPVPAPQPATIATDARTTEWMERLDIVRGLLREGDNGAGRYGLEKIVDTAPVCRAYQYALIDLAGLEVQSGHRSSARQLLTEAKASFAKLAADGVTRVRLNALEAVLSEAPAEQANAPISGGGDEIIPATPALQ